MSVTFTPGHTSQLLSRQYEVLREESRTQMQQAVRLTAEEMRHLAPGSISSHIAERVGSRPGIVTGTVFPTEAWARYVDEGTGIYVEHHGPIRSKRPGGALKFKNGMIRRSSKGQRPQRFVERTEAVTEGRVLTMLDAAASRTTARLR